MKYTINHEEEFTNPHFAFVILLWALFMMFLIEGLNIFQILHWSTVEYTVIYLMAFRIIMLIPKLYFDSLLDDPIKDMLCKNFSRIKIKN